MNQSLIKNKSKLSEFAPKSLKENEDIKIELSEDSRITEVESLNKDLETKVEDLTKENKDLRTILKDYEKENSEKELLLEKREEECKNLNIKVEEISKLSYTYMEELKICDEKMTKIEKEKLKLEISLEMNTSHLETKVRLMKEALNKRNEDYKEIENNNGDLVKLLESCDQKLVKLDEDFRLENEIRNKYERLLEAQDGNFKKISIETIDTRISFMVGVLEEYRKMLEEDSEEYMEGYQYNYSDAEEPNLISSEGFIKSEHSEPLRRDTFSDSL
mmetsp:Transcript_1095/g.974  ORF Transcript_1095/g.974 Transcript_1095/m.974 type:complete len:275 (+) Transcript_1095:209-1033(+)